MIHEVKSWGPDAKTRRAVERFEAQIARDLDDAYAYVNMGLWWHWNEEYARALDHYDTAVRLDPVFAHARCARASLLATCPDARYRNGEVAVRDATVALDVARESGQLTTNWKHRMYLETLAAALAECGDFDAAVQVEQEALPLCITRINEETANARIAQFRAGVPLRVEEGLVRSGPPRRTE